MKRHLRIAFLLFLTASSTAWAFWPDYDGAQFPKAYFHEGFACEHGSWNRARRVGYKVIRIPMNGSQATGEYEDFLTGFVTKEGNVWGRPVGVTVAGDGALMVTDDGSGTIWRVAYKGK